MSKIKNIPLWLKILFTLLIIIVLSAGFSMYQISNNPEGAALFADNVLRPILGEKLTIGLEGAVFGIQDKINRAQNADPAKKYFTSNINEAPINVSSQSALPAFILPTNINPIVSSQNPLPDEGVWKAIEASGLYTTFIRTDSTRPFAVVNLVYIPLHNVSIGVVAGTKHPGGELKQFGPGIVPKEIQDSGKLIAAFNGGFQEKDGHYGMYVNGVTYVPLKNKLATLFIYKDGSTAIQKYDSSLMTEQVLAARQNGPLLIEGGQVVKSTSQGIALWAGTSAGDYVTWRSGLGVTANGDLIYAAGPSLTPQSLGDALRLAGSTQAMQLDINNFWVRFILYSWNPDTKSYSYLPLTKGLPNAGKQFLTGDEKDFFYLYRK